MSKGGISEQLREAAALLLDPDKDARFICHTLADVAKVWRHYGRSLPAAQYLLSLGMPMEGGGFTEFGRCSPQDELLELEELREWRAVWCLFAADLWDEGVVQ